MFNDEPCKLFKSYIVLAENMMFLSCFCKKKNGFQSQIIPKLRFYILAISNSPSLDPVTLTGEGS